MAVDVADSILVTGHSLHDPALNRALGRVAPSKPVVVSYFGSQEPGEVKAAISGARPIKVGFGPEIEADNELRSALEEFQRPAYIKAS